MLPFVALSTAVVFAAPAPGQPKVFADWVIACDNTLACEAVNLDPVSADIPDGLSLSIKRGSAADHPGWIAIHPGRDTDIRLIDRTRLMVDNRPLNVPFRVSGGGIWVEAQHIRPFITRLRRGTMLQVAEANGRIYGGASLDGFVDALRHMDETQRRVGTVTAWIARGPRAADTIPAPPPRPVVAAPLRSDLPPRDLSVDGIRRISRPEPCRREPDREPTPTYARLDATTTLALVPWGCSGGLSYNTTEYAVVIDESGTVTPARFDVELGGADAPPNELTSSWWDTSHGLIRTGIRGRGLGDCGQTQSFAWDGTRFRLIAQAEMPACRGATRFLSTWQAELRRR